MTDIPEHLLARSRERRAALGLGGGDAGGGRAEHPGRRGSPASPSPAATPAPVRGRRPRWRLVRPEATSSRPKPDPPYVAAAKARPRVPIFVAPVLAMLPVFAFIYWGSLTPKPVAADPVLVEGAALYSANCAACHGRRRFRRRRPAAQQLGSGPRHLPQRGGPASPWCHQGRHRSLQARPASVYMATPNRAGRPHRPDGYPCAVMPQSFGNARSPEPTPRSPPSSTTSGSSSAVPASRCSTSRSGADRAPQVVLHRHDNGDLRRLPGTAT